MERFTIDLSFLNVLAQIILVLLIRYISADVEVGHFAATRLNILDRMVRNRYSMF